MTGFIPASRQSYGCRSIPGCQQLRFCLPQTALAGQSAAVWAGLSSLFGFLLNRRPKLGVSVDQGQCGAVFLGVFAVAVLVG